MIRIGLISDTHGLMRPEALAALAGVEHIVHAGDIGSPDVLEQLKRIAPVTAVRGNNDTDAWAMEIAEREVLEVGGGAVRKAGPTVARAAAHAVARATIYILHDLKELDLDPAASGFAVVVTGHSHKPLITRKDGVLFVNPGSAGRRRFKLPVTVATLELAGDEIRAALHDLTP